MIKPGDAMPLSSLFNAGSFDVILCDNGLEYVDDRAAVLCGTACLIRGSGAILCILVRNQVGEELKAALSTGDLLAAEDNLAAEWGQESLYGGRVQLFSGALEAMLKEASLTIVAKRGVRVVADYLPSKISRTAECERIFSWGASSASEVNSPRSLATRTVWQGCAAARSEGD